MSLKYNLKAKHLNYLNLTWYFTNLLCSFFQLRLNAKGEILDSRQVELLNVHLQMIVSKMINISDKIT